MGVCEGLTQFKPGMHWQHQDRHQQMLLAAYDPSRDLSPNLPTTTSCQQESMTSLSNGPPSRCSSNGGCNTPINTPSSNTKYGVGMCCSFKEEYDAETCYSKIPVPSDCQDCIAQNLRNNHHQPSIYQQKESPYDRPSAIICKAEVDSALQPISYNCHDSPHSHIYEYRGPHEYPPVLHDMKQEHECIAGSRSPHEDEILKMCAGCGRKIVDRFYLYAVDRHWHVSCLQCSQCRRTLDDEVTCFAKDGNIYCRKDYQKLFGLNRCSRCKLTISSTELVMRAKDCVFHLPCFFCVVCMTVLTKGDHFGMRDGQVYCRIHYESLSSIHQADQTGTSQSPAPSEIYTSSPISSRFLPTLSVTPSSMLQTLPSSEFPAHDRRLLPPPSAIPLLQQVNQTSEPVSDKLSHSFYNGVNTPRPKGRPRKRKPKDLDSITCNSDLNSEYMDLQYTGGNGSSLGSGNSHHHHHQRTKRMRTSFKHHQLRTMKTYFTVNHNPDAKDLKQLSQKTGLAKRVLQVWFQNARAKWRRMLNKQENGSSSGGCLKNLDEKSCSEGSGSALDGVYHGSLSLSSHSPEGYLSPSSMDCNSS